MSISAPISRFSVYLRRNGFSATATRIGLSLRRSLFSGRMALFYCDLSTRTASPAELPCSLKIERYRSQSELSSADFGQITSFWNTKLARRNIHERFALGASIWVIRADGKLAGYGWTLQGRTVEPHYFPLGHDDVHFFDFHVFPDYRGRGINPRLVSYILARLAAECSGRAFIEAAEWNRSQLASLKKTPFHCFGIAQKITVGPRTVVYWQQHKHGAKLEREVQNVKLPATDGSCASDSV